MEMNHEWYNFALDVKIDETSFFYVSTSHVSMIIDSSVSRSSYSFMQQC